MTTVFGLLRRRFRTRCAANNPPQIVRSQLSNSMLGSGQTTPQDYRESSGFGGRREREWGPHAPSPRASSRSSEPAGTHARSRAVPGAAAPPPPVRCEKSMLASPIPQTWYAYLITLPHLGIPGSRYYGGASHGPDVAFAVPVFRQGRLVAFAATTAHHLDIGALSPGSCGIVDAIDAYAEGLQFKAIKVYDRSVRHDAVWQLLRDNIRVSDLVVGDMEAQIAAARIGAERLSGLIERYGYERFTAACSA